MTENEISKENNFDVHFWTLPKEKVRSRSSFKKLGSFNFMRKKSGPLLQP